MEFLYLKSQLVLAWHDFQYLNHLIMHPLALLIIPLIYAAPHSPSAQSNARPNTPSGQQQQPTSVPSQASLGAGATPRPIVQRAPVTGASNVQKKSSSSSSSDDDDKRLNPNRPRRVRIKRRRPKNEKSQTPGDESKPATDNQPSAAQKTSPSSSSPSSNNAPSTSGSKPSESNKTISNDEKEAAVLEAARQVVAKSKNVPDNKVDCKLQSN